MTQKKQFETFWSQIFWLILFLTEECRQVVLVQVKSIIIIQICTYTNASTYLPIWCTRYLSFILPPAHQTHKSFVKPSQLPGQYTVQLELFPAHIGLIKHNNQLCPHRYPFTPGWREAIMFKCLVQGHKHQAAQPQHYSPMKKERS